VNQCIGRSWFGGRKSRVEGRGLSSSANRLRSWMRVGYATHHLRAAVRSHTRTKTRGLASCAHFGSQPISILVKLSQINIG